MRRRENIWKIEYSYDKGAENVLKDAQVNNWLIVSMKNDFKKIYPWSIIKIDWILQIDG